VNENPDFFEANSSTLFGVGSHTGIAEEQAIQLQWLIIDGHRQSRAIRRYSYLMDLRRRYWLILDVRWMKWGGIDFGLGDGGFTLGICIKQASG